MNLGTFFEKFNLFADTPNAVAKMRELVLHLAVTGKLVNQDPRDEPACQLLKHINAERSAALKARQISSAKPLQPVEDVALLFDLPSGWSPARLIELVMEIQTGPFGSSLHKSDYQLGGTPVINPASLRDGKIVPIDEMAIGDATLKRLQVFKLKARDIVMARRGEMGRCAIVTEHGEGWLCGTGSLVLRMPRSLHAPYLAMLIGAPMARKYLGRASIGATMENLNQSILARMPVGVPPLAEQKRIVAKVDELMALCDRVEAQQKERAMRHAALARASLARFADAPTPTNLNFIFHKSYDIAPADLRKTILTLAVQGKLVESDSSVETADELLAEMQQRRQDLIDAKRIRKTRDLPRVTEDELPFPVPASWRWTRWGQICDWITYGFTRPMVHVDKGPPIVTAKNVQDGFMTFENAHRAEASEFANLNPKDLPRKGDILITKDGTIGRAAVVETNEPFCINQSVAVLWLESCLLYRPFLLMVIRSPFAQGPIWEAAEGMAIKHLSITDFGKMILPVPPIAEQRRIVAKVDELMALVDVLESQLATARTTARKLMETVVAELTAQQPTGVAGCCRRSLSPELM